MQQRLVQIPQLCHEDWSKMTNVEGGKLCAKCNKFVRNFIGMDPSAIFEELDNATGELCGLFDRDMVAPPRLEGFALLRFPAERLRLFVIAFVVAFGLEVWGVSPAIAQSVTPSVQSLKDPRTLQFLLQTPNKEDIVLRGKVADVYTREPIVAAQVMAFDGERLLSGVVSDTGGNFELRIAKGTLVEETYQLRLRYLGRERRDHEIARDVTEFLYLIDASMAIEGITVSDQLLVDEISVLGGACITTVTTPTLRDRTWRTVTCRGAFEERSLYRPLDEWLMMHNSEIHLEGRW